MLRRSTAATSERRAARRLPELKDDGTTSCGCWIYCGVFAGGENQAARRKPHWEQSCVAPEWAWAWPANRRILYNRASADPDGKPWSERKQLVWWDGSEKKWTGLDVPDFQEDKPPDYVPPDDAEAADAIAGDHPFIMQADGRGWLFVPQGLEDGPLPTHYEPEESPFANPLYGQRANPRRQAFDRPENPYNPVGPEDFPYIATTYRLTEHHTAGGMSRTVPYLSELQPAMFCEVSPELAAESGPRQRRLGDDLQRPRRDRGAGARDRPDPAARVQGRQVHQVGMPYHWGTRGLTTGDAANDLAHIVARPERPHPGGRRRSRRDQAGPAAARLRCEFVDELRKRAR